MFEQVIRCLVSHCISSQSAQLSFSQSAMASVEMSTASTSTRESVTASQAAEGMDVLKSLLKPPG